MASESERMQQIMEQVGYRFLALSSHTVDLEALTDPDSQVYGRWQAFVVRLNEYVARYNINLAHQLTADHLLQVIANETSKEYEGLDPERQRHTIAQEILADSAFLSILAITEVDLTLHRAIIRERS